jgi:hypothetical protein
MIFCQIVALMMFTKAYSLGNQLRAMQHSAEFLKKISSPTPRFATQREFQFKVF